MDEYDPMEVRRIRSYDRSSISTSAAWGIFIFVFIVLIILIALLIFDPSIFGFNTHDLPIKLIKPNNIPIPGKSVFNSTFGESNNGKFTDPLGDGNKIDPVLCEQNGGRSHFVKNQCKCLNPFFGPKCDQEAVSNKYYDAGTVPGSAIVTLVNDQTTTFGSIPTPTQTIANTNPGLVNRLSFLYQYPTNGNNPINDPNLNLVCTQECDNTPGCNGVVYVPLNESDGVMKPDNECLLIKGIAMGMTGNLNWSPTHQGDLFMKKPNRPTFNTVGFVFQNSSAGMPLRFWAQDRIEEGFFKSQIVRTTGTNVNFAPTSVMADVPGVFNFTPVGQIGISTPITISAGDTGKIIPVNLNLGSKLIATFTPTVLF